MNTLSSLGNYVLYSNESDYQVHTSNDGTIKYRSVVIDKINYVCNLETTRNKESLPGVIRDVINTAYNADPFVGIVFVVGAPVTKPEVTVPLSLSYFVLKCARFDFLIYYY